MVDNPRTKPNCVCNYGDTTAKGNCWARLVVNKDEEALTCEKIVELDNTEPNNPKLYWLDHTYPTPKHIYCEDSVGNTGITCQQVEETDELGQTNLVCKHQPTPHSRDSVTGKTWLCKGSGNPIAYEDTCPSGTGPKIYGWSGPDCRSCVYDGKESPRRMPSSARCPYTPSPSPSPK